MIMSCFFPVQFWEDPQLTNNKRCKQCEPGEYQPTVGGSHCLTCDMGKYTSYSGSKSCVESCPRGSRTNRNTLASGCDLCPKGTYGDEKGIYNCIACEPGTRSKRAGSTRCKPCPRNWFMDLPGQYRCVACGPFCKSHPGSTKCAGRHDKIPDCSSRWINTKIDEPIGTHLEDWNYSENNRKV